MIFFEGVDKSGKDLVMQYFNKLTDYKYTCVSRGPLSAVVYANRYQRESESTLTEITDFDTIVYLDVEQDDLIIRHEICNEPEIDTLADKAMFAVAIDELTLMKRNIIIINTSYETPYNIARTLKDVFERGVEEHAKEFGVKRVVLASSCAIYGDNPKLPLTEDEKVDKLIEAVNELKAKLDIPNYLQDVGIAKKDFDARLDIMSEKAFDDQCTGANPRYPLISEIKAIYQGIFAPQ
jgi:hypothetical protein